MELAASTYCGRASALSFAWLALYQAVFGMSGHSADREYEAEKEMKLPRLKIILGADRICIRCGQHGYVGERCGLCLGCLNISLLLYAQRRKEGGNGSHPGSQLSDSSRNANEASKVIRAAFRVHQSNEPRKSKDQGS
jgi:hypothetical protein